MGKRKRTFDSEEHEISYLRKQNRLLKRTIGEMRKELKENKKTKHDYFKEGYDACAKQDQAEFDLRDSEIIRLKLKLFELMEKHNEEDIETV